MATKTMNVGVAAYDALAARKRPGESFTDVILRLTRSSGLDALVGVLSDGQAEAMKEDMRESRARSRARSDRMDACFRGQTAVEGEAFVHHESARQGS